MAVSPDGSVRKLFQHPSGRTPPHCPLRIPGSMESLTHVLKIKTISGFRIFSIKNVINKHKKFAFLVNIVNLTQ